MNTNCIQGYAKLTNLNTYGNSDPNNTSYDIISGEQSIKFVLIDQISSSSGYQGYAYKNLVTGEIVVVHAGSQDPTFANHIGEVYKDWVITDIMGTANKKITEQFYDSNLFLNKIRNEYKDSKIVQAGMSLGGTLCEMNAALAGNENIETYTYNSFGAGHMGYSLTDAGYSLSGDYSNIYNFTYNNEKVSTFNPHFGNVYKADYDETGFMKYHSIEAHANNNLQYNLVENASFLSDLGIEGGSIIINYEDTTGCFSFTIDITKHNFSQEELNNLLNLLDENGFLSYDGLIGYLSIDNELYTIRSGDTIWGIAQKYGISEEELIEANPWLSDRYSEDKTFALIRTDEQIHIPENKLQSTDTSDMYSDIDGQLKGEYLNPDIQIPEDSDLSLPSQGETVDKITYEYTRKRQAAA